MGKASGSDPKEFADMMAGFNAAIRIVNLTHSIFNEITQSYIPAASYAFASKRYKRFLKLTFNIYCMALVWGGLTCIITWTIPNTLSKMFSSEGCLKYARKIVLYQQWTCTFCWF